ncbi:hypothetical protein NELLIE_26 [Arthrobacter phage Nellie]|uniref:Uncharacterized protein n=4 Tax=Jasminevirus adat TaxID=2560299 RepID=A0A249XN73_9CAUD|nr:hypothetical protein FDI47_gp26 [Arthrobacter phage Adat]ASZ72599.1 hypothetical protein ADAT_26 [Arthrobacter phage Adat]ASZ73181.1 hypothetical protein GURGLEFERB_26 [Arthrobacter phage GurgleFerb]ASZ73745.1 hypothetical protein NELLIE_26 [Arthrobacter phage Nellie]AXH43715.1 hypothetical protein SEA_BRAD_26 [Arthrobacter phage Brad]
MANPAPSWRDVYALKAGLIADESAQSQGNIADLLSKVAFRDGLSNSSVSVGSSVSKLPKYQGPVDKDKMENEALDEAYKKGGWEGFQASVAKVAKTPVIKQIIDVLSVGTYATANMGKEMIEAQKQAASGDMVGGILRSLASPVVGSAKGFSAAFGNDNDVVTWGDNIKEIQELSGADTENDAAKWVQGIGGFVGDVALDPLTYATFGVGKAALAGGKGFAEGGKRAAGIAREAVGEAKAITGSDAVDLGHNISKIADKADTAGIAQRFKNAGSEAKAAYKDWSANEANGKLVKFELPFSGGKKLPQDAPDIAPQKFNAPEMAGLADLVNALGAKTVATNEKLIPRTAKDSPGLKKLLDSVEDSPIINSTKADELDKLTGDLDKLKSTPSDLHAAVSEIVTKVPFSRKRYDANTVETFRQAVENSKPRTIERQVEKEVEVPDSAPKPGPKASINVKGLIGDIRKAATKEGAGDEIGSGTIKYGGKPVHPRIVARDLDKATNGEQMKAVLRKLDPEFIARYKSDVQNIPTPKTKKEIQLENVVENVDGTPVPEEILAMIDPAHHSLDPIALRDVTVPTGNMRDRKQYIAHHATDDEIKLMIEQLGLPKVALRSEVALAFEKAYKEFLSKEREIQAANKAKGKNLVDPEANQNLAHMLDKITPEDTARYQAENVVEKVTGVVDEKYSEIVKVDDLAKMPERTFEAMVRYQSGVQRKYTTATGHKTSTEGSVETGGAVHPGEMGTMSLLAAHNEIIKFFMESGKLSSWHKAGMYRRIMEATYAIARQKGMNPVLDLGKKTADDAPIPLGMDDISDIFYDSVKKHMLSGPRDSIQPNALATGVEMFARGLQKGDSPEKMVENIMAAFTGDRKVYRSRSTAKGKRPDSGVHQNIIDSIRGIDGDGKTMKQGMVPSISWRVQNGADNFKSAKADYLDALEMTAKKWVNSPELAQRLQARILVNTKQANAATAADIARLTKEVEAEVIRLGNEGFSVGAYMDNMTKLLNDMEKAVSPEDAVRYNTMKTSMNLLRAKVMTEGEQATIRASSAVKAQTKKKPTVETRQAINKANIKTVDDSVKDAEVAVSEARMADPENGDFYDVVTGALSIDAWRKIHPVMGFFSTRAGFEGSAMYRAVGTGLHTTARMQSIFHSNVMRYMTENPNKLMEDWKTIQSEALSAKNKSEFVPSTESAKKLYNAISDIFDVSENNLITRNGIGSRHFNAVAEQKGLSFKLDENPNMSIHENSLSWLAHEGLKDGRDILDFMSKMHATAVHVANDISIASHFAHQFGSAVPKDGFVKLSWTRRAGGRNKEINRTEKDVGFFDLLPKDLYYDSIAAHDIANIHRVMNESRGIGTKTSMGKFINNVFDPVTNLLKAGQTTVRPGHWVMSIAGDTLRNHIAGVSTITPYKHSFGIMKAGGREMKEFGDNPLGAYGWHKQTANGDFTVHGKGDGVVMHVGGKPQKVSYESLFRMMQDGVIIPKHGGGGTAEDVLAGDIQGKFGAALNKTQEFILDNKKFSLNDLAANRDNFSRITLAIDHAMKGKYSSLQEMKSAMEEFVTKWAPTSSDFTAKEAKYARRAFLYYTWLRGITPRIIDTMMNKPGIATIANKALYNMAAANGVDPVSIGNPFPADRMFPSYYYKNIIGPQMVGEGMSLWGFNPSSPVIEVLNSISSGATIGDPVGSALNVGKTAFGMATPFIKMPTELITQQSNGIPIQDNAQYVQDQLGGAWGGLASKTTGKLITGNGRTDSSNGATPEEQAKIAKLQLANFLSGMKITDYQSPAALRSVRGEQKQKQTEAKKNFERNQ